MNKYKWMSADFGVSLATVGERLRKVEFNLSDDDSEGFRIEERSVSRLRGVFVERETSIEHFSLPTGHEYEEKRTRVTVTEFVATREASLNMLLVNPPRRTLPFFNAISLATNFRFSVESLDVDVLKWVRSLEREVGDVSVTFLDCNSIQLSPEITGRFAFRGVRDVRTEARRATKAANVAVECARCELSLDGQRATVELFRSGAAKVISPMDELFVGVLHKSLVGAQ
ncbi:hypothetical protein HFK89_05120 [Ralstonia pseudosolanacearum]|uniref:hypothetical protein n=1 Tax=Ralstonia pseudosolanacearum TaxID=1310165 RepID=UPI0011138B16|nr:hypothetical protein [Ralstonia pseudosolanacearum]MCK4161831.1 hypothetical protein [Ralstonia pseudosolanacearum]